MHLDITEKTNLQYFNICSAKEQLDICNKVISKDDFIEAINIITRSHNEQSIKRSISAFLRINKNNFVLNSNDINNTIAYQELLFHGFIDTKNLSSKGLIYVIDKYCSFNTKHVYDDLRLIINSNFDIYKKNDILKNIDESTLLFIAFLLDSFDNFNYIINLPNVQEYIANNPYKIVNRCNIIKSVSQEIIDNLDKFDELNKEFIKFNVIIIISFYNQTKSYVKSKIKDYNIVDTLEIVYKACEFYNSNNKYVDYNLNTFYQQIDIKQYLSDISREDFRRLLSFKFQKFFFKTCYLGSTYVSKYQNIEKEDFELLIDDRSIYNSKNSLECFYNAIINEESNHSYFNQDELEEIETKFIINFLNYNYCNFDFKDSISKMKYIKHQEVIDKDRSYFSFNNNIPKEFYYKQLDKLYDL